MDTIFMNSENNKTSDLHSLLLNLADRINLKRSDKYVALPNISIQDTWKNMKNHIKIISLKYQLQHGMRKFEIPDGSYSVSDNQDYFKHIFKKHDTVTDNPSIRK